MSRIEADIQDDIERQGRRLTLRQVICPNRVVKQAEAYFRCVGELPDGEQFTINVIQQDDQGNVTWDVPSSKVVINLVSLEEKIAAGTKEAVGKRLAIDCGDTYRINQRGDTFECDVVGTGFVPSGRVVSILVKVAADRNLEWQEVVVSDGPVASPASGPTAAGAIPAGAVPATTTPSTSATATPAKTATDQETIGDEGPSASATPTSATPAAPDTDDDDDGDRQ